MTTFVMLTGLRVPIENASVRVKFHIVGEDGEVRTVSGGFSDDVRSVKREWTFNTTPIQAGEAMARWIAGRKMWHIPLNERLSSDNGLAPLAGYTGALVTTPTRFSSRSYGGVTGELARWRIPLPFGSTSSSACVWHRDTTFNTWNHFARVSAPSGDTRYKNAVVSPGEAGFFTFASGSPSGQWFLNLGSTSTGAAAANSYHQELLLVGWSLTADMVSAIYAQNTVSGSERRLPEFPVHELRGDMVRESPSLPASGSDTTFVRCVNVRDQYKQGRPKGTTFKNNLRVLTVTLREV